MTIAQLLEQVFGKLGAIVGAKMNATTFMNDEQSFKAIGDALEAMGFHREGEEILYSGITGKMFTTSVFMGPLYFMRLKHLAQDKINSRSTGRKEIRTHQPTGGRGNEGGMRIGEMERDALIAHGVTEFLQESMMKRSDGTTFWICNGCGTMPIYNTAQKLFVCPTCDGPITYQGETADTLGLVLPVKKSRTTFSQIEVPYALKLLDQELTTYANASVRFLTEKHMRTFRDLPTGSGMFAEETAATPTPTNTILDTIVATVLGPTAVAPTAAVTADAAASADMGAGAFTQAAPVEETSTPTSTAVAATPAAATPMIAAPAAATPVVDEASPTSTTDAVGEPTPALTPAEALKMKASTDAMFDFMEGSPKLEIIKTDVAPLPAPPTPEMPGPATVLPKVILEAGEGAPMPPPDLPAAPAPTATAAAIPIAEKRPRRSSMKGGRAAELTTTTQTPSPEIQAGDTVKVIKIDA
jgi:hypothetical protein